MDRGAGSILSLRWSLNIFRWKNWTWTANGKVVSIFVLFRTVEWMLWKFQVFWPCKFLGVSYLQTMGLPSSISDISNIIDVKK